MNPQKQKQAQIDFMQGQAISLKFQSHMQGQSIVAIANALALTLSGFCMTIDNDPHEALGMITEAARRHMADFDPVPPPAHEVN